MLGKVDDHSSECIGPGDYFSSDPIFWGLQNCSQPRVTAETPLEFIRLEEALLMRLCKCEGPRVLEERATNKLLPDRVPSLRALSYRDRLRLAEGLQSVELSANDGLSQDNNPGLYFLLEGEIDAINGEGESVKSIISKTKVSYCRTNINWASQNSEPRLVRAL